MKLRHFYIKHLYESLDEGSYTRAVFSFKKSPIQYRYETTGNHTKQIVTLERRLLFIDLWLVNFSIEWQQEV